MKFLFQHMGTTSLELNGGALGLVTFLGLPHYISLPQVLPCDEKTFLASIHNLLNDSENCIFTFILYPTSHSIHSILYLFITWLKNL